MSTTWRATAAPEGWKVGRWAKTSESTWEEQKIGMSEPPCAFEVVKGPTTPGSTTIRLRKLGDTVEVLILDTTVQVFRSGQYLGEYLGSWEGGPPAVAAAPRPAAPLAPVQQSSVSGGAPQQVAQVQAPVQQSFVSGGAPQQVAQVQVPMQAAPSPGAPSAAAAPVARPQKHPNLDRSPAKILALKNAVVSGDAAAVKTLLDAGVDPDEPCAGKTALLVAAEKGNVAVVEVLLGAGADPNTVGTDGSTPLTVAFQHGHKEVLSKLFSSTFQSLGSSMVTKEGLAAGRAEDGDSGAPDAGDDLREEALKDKMRALSQLSKECQSPRQCVGEENDQDISLDPNSLREEALRAKMWVLAAGDPGP